jgi:predicted DNA-binding transcriptional regulator YafY
LDDKIPWSVEQRLEFIEFRLFWEGRVNRSDLADRFGVSIPQASADLSRYQELAPGNIEYDPTAKTYVAAPRFIPVRYKPAAEQFLARLRSVDAGLIAKQDILLDKLPPMATVPVLRRRADAGILRTVLEAIRKGLAIHVHYQSLTSSEPAWRWIAPHAIGFDGFRWHARAWCSENNDFRDFVLARILATRGLKESGVARDNDLEWHQEVVLRIGTRADLEEGARRAIEIDYGMQNGTIEIRMRIALTSYFERLLVLDVDPSAIEPNRQPLVLLNREEVASARQRARELSTQRNFSGAKLEDPT